MINIDIFIPMLIICFIGILGMLSKNTTKINIICLCISAILFVSFAICLLVNKHIDSEFIYSKYHIQKLTFDDVIFNDKRYDLDENSIIIEKPNSDFVNVAIEEKEKYKIQWLYKIRIECNTYHVYLSEELYSKLQDGNVIYERKE